MQKEKQDLTQAQLFIDNTWIEDSLRVQRVFHQPLKFPKPVLTADRAYERWACIAYGTALFRDNCFHLWYVTWSRDSSFKVCYAVSKDGVAFEKPDLGLYEFEGSKHNNICLMLAESGCIDNISVIEDFDDAQWPLKAIFWQGMPKKELSGLVACRSKDGIHWDLTPGLVLPGFGDRTNAAAAKINGKFVVLTRIPNSPYSNCRMVWRLESEDLIHWSKPELIFKPDIEDDSRLEMYSATAFKYESLYLGFIERMHLRPDKLDSELVYSHDSHAWQRTRARNAFLPWGSAEAFDSRWLSMPSNGPLLFKNSLWFYYSGRSAAHCCPYPLNHGAIGLAVMRPDGFASLFNENGEGWIETPPMQWPDKELLINTDPRRDLTSHPFSPKCCQGIVRVEARDAEHHPLAGYGREDCQRIRNTLNNPLCRAPVLWKDDKSMRSMAGKTIRLAFYLQDAHLYSFAAGDKPA